MFTRILFLAALLSAAPALAALNARPAQIDHRVRTVMYQPDAVYKFTGHYGFQSSIEFGADENIQTISMGDSTPWMVQTLGNRLFLKPVEQSASTNMTLITDKRTYLFELHAREAQDINDDQMVFILRFIYSGGEQSNVVSHYLDSVPMPDIENQPGKYNFNYSISGPDTIAPIRIFDDGEFTYFEFRNKNADVPGFFLVGPDNSESLINFRTRGDYIVVERVGEKFTLRYGNQIVCVFNESYPQNLRAATLRQGKQEAPATPVQPGTPAPGPVR